MGDGSMLTQDRTLHERAYGGTLGEALLGVRLIVFSGRRPWQQRSARLAFLAAVVLAGSLRPRLWSNQTWKREIAGGFVLTVAGQPTLPGVTRRRWSLRAAPGPDEAETDRESGPVAEG